MIKSFRDALKALPSPTLDSHSAQQQGYPLLPSTDINTFIQQDGLLLATKAPNFRDDVKEVIMDDETGHMKRDISEAFGPQELAKDNGSYRNQIDTIPSSSDSDYSL